MKKVVVGNAEEKTLNEKYASFKAEMLAKAQKINEAYTDIKNSIDPFNETKNKIATVLNKVASKINEYKESSASKLENSSKGLLVALEKETNDLRTFKNNLEKLIAKHKAIEKQRLEDINAAIQRAEEIKRKEIAKLQKEFEDSPSALRLFFEPSDASIEILATSFPSISGFRHQEGVIEQKVSPVPLAAKIEQAHDVSVGDVPSIFDQFKEDQDRAKDQAKTIVDLQKELAEAKSQPLPRGVPDGAIIIPSKRAAGGSPILERPLNDLYDRFVTSVQASATALSGQHKAEKEITASLEKVIQVANGLIKTYGETPSDAPLVGLFETRHDDGAVRAANDRLFRARKILKEQQDFIEQSISHLSAQKESQQ